MRIERTKNTIRNSIWGFINKIVMLLFPFAIRTVIIKILGTEYVGLHSLFTSIISMLSLAELGFNTAMVYSMYQPIADGDDEKICALMNLYKTVYRFVGLVVLALGIILMPFLPKFIHDTIPENVNLYILYGLYLFNSVSSYWLFAYKNCILIAMQRNDISTNISTVCHVIMYLAQIVGLIIAKNYYIYIIWLPIGSIAINLITARYVSKNYPQFICKGHVNDKELKSIKKQVSGLLTQRLAYSSRNAFDSIILSSMLGLTIVGIYNNYFYILSSVTAILAILFTSMQAGIGNSIAKETKEKNQIDMTKIRFLYMVISGICSICIFVLIQPFMILWVGKELMFSNTIAGMLAFYFYSMKMTDPVGAYISGTGLWWKCKVTYILEAAVNLVLNIGLGYFWGVTGVIVATIISVLFVNYFGSTYILHKYYFGINGLKKYIANDITYMIVTVIIATIVYFMTDQVFLGTGTMQLLITLLLRLIICVTISSALYYLAYHRSEEYKISTKWIYGYIKRIRI